MPRDISITIGDREAVLRVGLYEALLAAVRSLTTGRPEAAFVVDVGAGRGELLALLGDAGIDRLGLDPEEDCVAAARRFGPCAQGGVAELGEALNGRRPDVVVCSHVLEHLRDPTGALEAMRATGASGFVFAVPNVHRPSRMMRVTLGGRRPDHPAHIFGWGQAEFAALLAATGFAVVRWRADRVTLSPFGGGFGSWATRRLRPVEERWLPAVVPNLASSLIAECRPAAEW